MDNDLIERALLWFKELLRIDTSNPPGNEKQAITFIAKILESEGIDFTIIAKQPNRPNLVAEVRGSAATDPFLVSSHIDVVPAENEQWSLPPFGAEEREGEIYGRGALDVKYKCAFDLALLVQAKRKGIARTLKMVVLADEEQGGEYGVRYLINDHRSLIAAAYVFNEVGGFNVALAGRPFVLVQTGEKGRVHLRLSCCGAAHHASTPLAHNPVVTLSRLISIISGTLTSYQLCATVTTFLAKVANNLEEPGRSLFDALRNPLHYRTALLSISDAGLRAQLQAMVENTFVPTILRSGTSLNVVPEIASVDVDCRLVPGTDREAFLTQVRAAVAEAAMPGCAVECLSCEDGYELNTHDPFVAQVLTHVESEWQARLPGMRALPMLLPASSDNSTYYRAGITPIGFAPLLFPDKFPGFALAHGSDERLPREAFIEGLKCYFSVMRKLGV